MLDREAVKKLGEQLGYGRIMQLCEELWRDEIKSTAHEGGEFTIGCDSAMLDECDCTVSNKCDWCCGIGRVTEKVKQAMDSE